MNHIHYTIFNRCLGLVQVVGENAKRRGKSGTSAGTSVGASAGGAAIVGFTTNATIGRFNVRHSVLAISLVLGFIAPGAALAAPQGGEVTVGSKHISIEPGAHTVVTQTNQQGIINWQGFSIARDESVTFRQPDSAAVILNRVIGKEQSLIDGALKANGQIFLVNPQGVLFGGNAVVDVGGLVASTRDITDASFIDNAGEATGAFRFSGEGAGVVKVEKGAEIAAAEKGYVALLGQSVHNQGHIVARKGVVALAAGKTITLSLPQGNLGVFNINLTEGDYNVLVENSGVIEADGGLILLTARAAENLANIIVNNTGVLQARTLADLTGGGEDAGGRHAGKIELVAVGGGVSAGGTIDASGLQPTVERQVKVEEEEPAENGGSGEGGSGAGSETDEGNGAGDEEASNDQGSGGAGGEEVSGDQGGDDAGDEEASNDQGGDNAGGEEAPNDQGGNDAGGEGGGDSSSSNDSNDVEGSGPVEDTGPKEGSDGPTGGEGDGKGAAPEYIIKVENVDVPISGGAIVISGESVALAEGAKISTLGLHGGETGGLRLESGGSLVVGDGGGAGAQQNAQQSIVAADVLSAVLAQNNVTLAALGGAAPGEEAIPGEDSSGEAAISGGDITLDEAVAWNADTRLTLDAAADIYINNAITAAGEKAGLTLKHGAGADYHILTKASFSGVEVVPHTEGVPGAGLSKAKADTSGGVYGSVTFTHEGNKDGLIVGDQPYALIHSLDELAAISGKTGNYALAKNLDASGKIYTAAVVGTLAGGSVFTGLGHVIDNLKINAASGNVGLFGAGASNNKTTLRYLGVTNVEITGGSYVGALIGRGYLIDIDHTYSMGKISGFRSAGGGIAGSIGDYSGTSQTEGNFSGIDLKVSNISDGMSGSTGGLFGSTTLATVRQSHATGVITVPGANTVANAGGLIGKAMSIQIDQAYATGTITKEEGSASGSMNVGGLIGSIDQRDGQPAVLVENSFATGHVRAERGNAGGLIGQADAAYADITIYNSYATGDVTAIATRSGSTNIGGLLGYGLDGNLNNAPSTFSIIESWASGDVAHESYKSGDSAGGLVTRLASELFVLIDSSHASGNITGANAEKSSTGGGLMGAVGITGSHQEKQGITAIITNSYATGDVSGYQIVGGLVGSNFAHIENSYATGDVEGAAVGGLVGANSIWGTIIGSYATGSVHEVDISGGVAGAGGLVGKNTGTINQSYAAGTVSSDRALENSFLGALVGVNESTDIAPGSVTNSYYANDNANPDVPIIWGQQMTDEGYSGGTISSVGTLGSAALGAPNVRDAILSGGDVAGAIADYNTAHTPTTPTPPVSEPPTSNLPATQTPANNTSTSTPPVVEVPVAKTPAVDEPVARPPVTENPVVENPVAENPAVNEPIAETPAVDAPIVESPIAETPITNDSVAEVTPPNIVELDAAQTIATQITNSRTQRAVNVLPDAIRTQANNLEQAHIPLDQLMAHLSNATAFAPAQPAPAPASETPKPGFDSNVNNIVGDGECLATDDSCGNKK